MNSPLVYRFGDAFIYSGVVLSRQFGGTHLESNVSVIANRSTGPIFHLNLYE